MEELLRQAFQHGQQWVQDMINGEEPTSFNDWYASYKVHEKIRTFYIKAGVKPICIMNNCAEKVWMNGLCRDHYLGDDIE